MPLRECHAPSSLFTSSFCFFVFFMGQLPCVCVTRVTFCLLFLQQIVGYTAGIDYPNYSEIPKGSSFSCQNRLPGKI